MSETFELLQAANHYANIQGNIIGAISSEEAYARNQPGSSGPPYFRDADRIQAMADYIDGERHVEFEMRVWEGLREMAERLDLIVQPRRWEGQFYMNISDPTEGAWSDTRLMVFFHPDGALMGAHSQRYGLHVRSTAKQTPDFMLGQVVGLFTAARERELAERRVRLERTNAGREARGLEPFPTWSHMAYPNNKKVQEAAMAILVADLSA